MKIGFYIFHRMRASLRLFARQAGPRVVFNGMGIAFILSSLHELAYRYFFPNAPDWVGNVSTVVLATLMTGLAAYLALLTLRHVAEQQDDEEAARQRLNRELVEERNLLRSMMENSQELIYFKDRESRFLRVNEAMAHRHGFTSSGEMIGKTDADLFPELLAKQKLDDEKRILASGGTIAGIEESDITQDGRIRWVTTSKMPMRDRQGQIVGTFGISRDITERKNAEEKFRGLLESAPDAMVITNVRGTIVLVNSATEKLFGYAREELLGKPVDLLMPLSLRGGKEQYRRDLFSSPRARHDGPPLELIAVRKNGCEFPAEVSLSPLETSEGVLVSSAIRDITDRKRAERRQEDVSAGLHKILQISDELTACADEDAIFKCAVELARQQLGIERCAIFIDGGDVVRGTYGTDMRGGTTDERAYRLPRSGIWEERLRLRAPNEKRWSISEETYHELTAEKMESVGRGPVAVTLIQSSQHHVIGVFCNDNAISAAPMDPAKQEVIAVYCSLIGNIVARKRAEQERKDTETRQRTVMERTDRLTGLGMLAAGMAHEINNPLQGMLSHVRALQPYVPAESAGRMSLDMVQKGIDTIASLVRRLLMLGSGDERNREGADVLEAVEFVSQLLESQFRRTSVRIERDVAAKNLRLAISRAELIQILMNLLINARDAMSGGGTVKLRAEMTGSEGVLTVSDTGQGMPPEVLEKIFAPFFTTKGTKGTGLGLSVTESIVRSNGGTISVSSQPGQGTTFVVRLPLREGDKA